MTWTIIESSETSTINQLQGFSRAFQVLSRAPMLHRFDLLFLLDPAVVATPTCPLEKKQPWTRPNTVGRLLVRDPISMSGSARFVLPWCCVLVDTLTDGKGKPSTCQRKIFIKTSKPYHKRSVQIQMPLSEGSQCNEHAITYNPTSLSICMFNSLNQWKNLGACGLDIGEVIWHNEASTRHSFVAKSMLAVLSKLCLSLIKRPCRRGRNWLCWNCWHLRTHQKSASIDQKSSI